MFIGEIVGENAWLVHIIRHLRRRCAHTIATQQEMEISLRLFPFPTVLSTIYRLRRIPGFRFLGSRFPIYRLRRFPVSRFPFPDLPSPTVSRFRFPFPGFRFLVSRFSVSRFTVSRFPILRFPDSVSRFPIYRLRRFPVSRFPDSDFHFSIYRLRRFPDSGFRFPILDLPSPTDSRPNK